MATETELERLVVRLMGDGSEYKQMLEMAAQQTRMVSKEVEGTTKKVEDIGKGLQSFAGSVLNVLGSFGIVGSLQAAFGKFSEMETGQIRLKATIEGTGRAVDEVMGEYMAFARSIETSTLLTKGQTLGMVQQAEALGLQGEAAQRAVQNSIGLAGALGGEADSYIRVAIAMEHGNAQMLQRILRLQHGSSESEIFAQAQEVINRGLRIQQAQMNTTSGQIQKLQRSFNDVSKEIGGLIARAINPLISGLLATINWFKSLDPTVRTVTLTVLTLLLAIRAYPGAVTILSAVLGNLATTMQLVRAAATVMLGPWGVVILAAIALIGYFVQQMGGWQKAWEAVTEAATELWDTIQPILLQLREVFMAAWGALSSGATAAWQIVSAVIGFIVDLATGLWKTLTETWSGVAEAAQIAWTVIKVAIALALVPLTGGLSILLLWINDLEGLRDAFFRVQHVIENFGAYSQLVFTGIALAWVKVTEEFKHFFNTVLPAYIAWLQQNWLNLFTDMFNLSVTIIGNLVSNIVSLIVSIPDLISGQTRWEDVWRPLTEGFESSVAQLPEIAGREIGQVERELQREFDQQRNALDTSFDAFRRRRLAEMNDQSRQAERDGSRIGQNMNKGLGKELGKFDAALSGSAEALSRIAAFQEAAQARSEGGLGGGRGNTPGGPRNRPQAPRAPGGGGFNLANVLGDLGTRLWNSITAAVTRAWDNIVAFVISTWTNVVNSAIDFWNNLPENALNALGAIGAAIGSMIDTVANAAFQFWDDLPDNIEWLWNQASQFASDTWDAITTLATAFWDNLPENLAAIWTAIQNAGVALWNGILNTATAVWNALPGPASGAWDRIVTIARAVWDRIIELVQQAFSRITGAPAEALRNVSSGIRERTGIDLEGAANSLRDAASSLSDFGSGAIATINPANWLG